LFAVRRTRVANPLLSSQAALTQSTASASTVTGSGDHSSSLPSASELYQIISRPPSKDVTATIQQVVDLIRPLDGNMLEIGQSVLLSTQENINFIHEIFRQVRRRLNEQRSRQM
jgi:hypothetical protein